MKKFLPLVLVLVVLSRFAALAADRSAMHVAKPLTPAQALAALQVEAGLRVELAVAEPLTASPCAVAWDERGRMFVAENRGYPVGPGTNQPPAGVIALLESTRGDGVYDKRTVFAEGLTFPNGILCWRGGVIVTCAPDIFFLQDTDGDGRADVKKVLLTGFGTTSTTQLRVSHPTLGLDGWVHVTSGLVASKVTCPEHPERAAVELPRGDARFHPDTLEIESWPGVGQFGLAFDDFGRKFVCSNRNPLQHVVLHPRYLKRNPHLAFSETVQDVAPPGDAAKCWPLSEDHTTAAFIPSLMSAPHAGTFTSACGISLWRGGALPAGFANSAFICEPAQNLVQRQVLTPDGPTFKSAPATPGREFLASRDTWFRPVFSATGPDGALYICDMYRKVIDHPQYLPEHIRGSLDYEAGKTNGRIWRVTDARQLDGRQKEKGERQKFDLGKASTEELVGKLNDENGWVRGTAFRLLLERGDKAVVPKLKSQIADAKPQSPAARVAAMHLLDHVGRLTLDDLEQADYGGTETKICALQLVEPRVSQRGTNGVVSNTPPAPIAVRMVNRYLRNRELGVRFQAWLLAGELNPEHQLWVAPFLTDVDARDRWMRAAALSCWNPIRGIYRVDESKPFLSPFQALYYEQSRMAATVLAPEKLAGQLAVALDPGIAQSSDQPALLLGSRREVDALAIASVLGIGDGVRTRTGTNSGARSLFALTSSHSKPEVSEFTRKRLQELFDYSANIFLKGSSDNAEKVLAVRLLAHSDFATAGAALQSLISAQTPNELQVAAVRALSQLPDAQAGEWLVARERWRSYTPPVQDAVLNALLARGPLQLVLLDAVEQGVVQPWAVPANRRGALLKHKDAAVAARAAKAFQPQGAADRMKVYEEYKPVAALPGNGTNGHAVFTKTCAACHQFAGEGARVGPDLTGVRNQPAEAILLHILVPDAEIYPGFTAYEIETRDGRLLTGLLTSDTPTSVTLRAAQGVEETILRANLAKLTSSSTSLMPNELEKTMTRQELADLLAFLRGM